MNKDIPCLNEMCPMYNYKSTNNCQAMDWFPCNKYISEKPHIRGFKECEFCITYLHEKNELIDDLKEEIKKLEKINILYWSYIPSELQDKVIEDENQL